MEHIGYKGPGKFEGEPCYAAHFYEQSLDGCSDDFYDGCTQVSCLEITAEDVADVPCCLDADDIGKTCLLWETEQGFVYTRLVTADELTTLKAECEQNIAEED